MTDGLRGTGGPATGDLVRDGVAIPVIHRRSPARGPRLDLVIGIDAADDAAALESAEVLEAELLERLSARPRAVFRVGGGAATPHFAAPFGCSRAPLGVLLDAARTLGGVAIAIVAARPAIGMRPLADLIAPALEQRCDVVAGCYPGRGLDGAIQSGIAYPVTRALFGAPLRQPFTRELALSRRAVEHLLAHDEWLDDVAAPGPELWIGSPALTRALRMGQTWLESRPDAPRALGDDPATVLCRALTVLFRATERYAGLWQHGGPSTPVATLCAPSEAAPTEEVDTSRMLETFRIATRELGLVWRCALSPATSSALQRAADLGDVQFRLADGVWARAIYECALSWHLRRLPRPQLVRSMSPLYCGWLAGFAREVRDGTPARVERRVETLCQAFEGARHDLVARWRWPESFVDGRSDSRGAPCGRP